MIRIKGHFLSLSKNKTIDYTIFKKHEYIFLKLQKLHLRSWPSGGSVCSISLYLDSNFIVHTCHPRDALHAHWVCRIFSES